MEVKQVRFDRLKQKLLNLIKTCQFVRRSVSITITTILKCRET